ncbi:MAG: DUF2608 domain-containing protein [Puniceicoccales bacterium]|jgi:hypothetical protein|nr:DUF2608 domain-containing protein [Puniceicoccales bacterium]
MKWLINSLILCLLIRAFTSFVSGSNPYAETQFNAPLEATLQPGVYSVNSESDACIFLQQAFNAYNLIKDPNKSLTIFLDIDDTIIPSWADVGLYEKNGSIQGLQTIIPQIIKILQEKKASDLKGSINLTGLTSANILNLKTEGWGNKLKLIINEETQNGKSTLTIRTDAMHALGIPFDMLSTAKTILPVVVQEATGSGYSIRELQEWRQNPNGSAPVIRENIRNKTTDSDGRLQIDSYYKFNLPFPDGPKALLIYPAYDQGIIFVGATDFYWRLVDEGKGCPAKGSAMYTFLSTLPNLPSAIIGIDDGKENLEGMAETCKLLENLKPGIELPFYGIHLTFTK